MVQLTATYTYDPTGRERIERIGTVLLNQNLMMHHNLINKIHAYIFLQRLYAYLLVLKYSGFTYNTDFRISSETVNGANSISFTYNSDFRVSAETVNGANSISFTYDNDGLLTGAGNLTLTRNTSNGLISGTTLGLVTTSQSYNSFGEVSQFTASNSGSQFFNIQYTRDKLGRITDKPESINGVSYTEVG